MKNKLIDFLLLAGIVLAFAVATMFLCAPLLHAQTVAAPIAEAGDMVTACAEPCVITGFTGATSVTAQFGIAATWGPTFTLAAAQLPLTVSYASTNLVLSPFDPAPNIVKNIAFQRQAASYTVQWTLNGASGSTLVPALMPTSLATPLGAAYAVTISNFVLSGPAAAGAAPPGPEFNVTIGGVTLLCEAQPGFGTLNCVVSTTPPPVAASP